jgi:AAA domain
MARPLVAELVGPAGAGKSALSQRLVGRVGALRASVWKLPRGWWLLNAVRSLPALAALCLVTWSLPWEDMRQIVRLRTLRQLLDRRTARQAPLVVLDEGPVFALAYMRLFGYERWRRNAPAPWWHRALHEWVGALDLVVQLDAPDAVLASRIRTRDKQHRVKQSSDAEIDAFTAAYRSAYTLVIDTLVAETGARVTTLQSDGEGADRTAERLLELLKGNGHGE